jgi:prepilin-type N-terminal cleavage/methylation domain-containing protein
VISVDHGASSEAGMTLVELLIAMVVMTIGITAIVAGFSSGIFTVVRAAKDSSAGALADQQMEAIRGVNYSLVAVATPLPTTAPYTTDSAYPSPSTQMVTTTSCSQNYCNPSRTTTAPNGGSYRIDTYVRWKCTVPGSTMTGPPTPTPPTCSTVGIVSSRAVKLVTVVVRDGSNPSKTRFRESSTFDQVTG